MTGSVREEAERKLHEVLDRVSDETTFCAFLQALAEDWVQDREILERDPATYKYSAGPLGWENGTIGDFLGAASVGLYNRSDETNIWRRAATIVWLGKIYE